MALIDYKRSELPVEYAHHLDSGVVSGFFAKRYSVGSWILLSIIALIPVAVFVIHVVVTFQAGRQLKKDDWVPALVVLTPITWWALARLEREIKRRRLVKIGQNPIGLFFAKNFVIWQHAEDLCHVIDRADLKNLGLTFGRLHRPARPRESYFIRSFILEFKDGTVVSIDDAGDYNVGTVLAAFKVWDAGIAVRIPEELETISQIFSEKQVDPELFSGLYGVPQEEKWEQPLPRPAPGTRRTMPRPNLHDDEYFMRGELAQRDRSLESLLQRYPGASHLGKVPADFVPDEDPISHFEQLLAAARIPYRFERSQPDGTNCHTYDQPLIIQRRLLDWLFALVLEEVDDFNHIVEPSIVDAKPWEYVAVLWFDFDWNDYRYEAKSGA